MPFAGARPDEGKVVGTAAGFVSRGTLDPRFFNYPTLFMYGLGGTFAAICGIGAAAHVFETAQACLDADAELILIGRVVSALTGIGGVALIYFIGRRLHPRAGLPAALLMAVAFLHVRDSHFAVTDVPMTTMLLLALVLLLRADERPSAGRFAIAGLAAGLAASTKYNAVFVAAAAVVSQIAAWFERADARPSSTRVKHTRLVVFGTAALAGFFIGTPYALLSPGQFMGDVRYESWHLMNAHLRIVVDVGWRQHALVTLPLGVGWTLLVTGVAGIVWALMTKRRQAAMIFAFPLIYYVVAGRGQTVFVRYMVPIVPFICLGAGAVIASAHGAFERRGRRFADAVAAVFLLLCAAPTALKAVAFDRLLSQTDSRVLAAKWIMNHVPAGATVLMTGNGLELWPVSTRPDYRVWMWHTDGSRLTGPEAERPDWIVVEESPLRHYSWVPGELQPILHDYVFRQAILAARHSERHVYDQQDAFYVPFDGFDGVARPGPNLSIYERPADLPPRMTVR